MPPRKNGTQLSDREKRFVEEYLIDCNATAAMRRAGYTDMAPNTKGSDLLKKKVISDAIAVAMEKRSKKIALAQARVVEELCHVAFARVDEFMTWGPDGLKLLNSSELMTDKMRAIKTITETVTQFGGTTSFVLHDKLKALELLGRHLGMFTTKLQVVPPSTGSQQEFEQQKDRIAEALKEPETFAAMKLISDRLDRDAG